jgi:penicillin-binding protein 2
MAKKFGFGCVTGIEVPGERGGFIPDDEYISSLDKNKKWSSGDTVNLSIGHGKILITPIQAACFISAIANGGILYKPKIIFGEDPEGKEIDLDKKYIDLVKKGLYRVVNEPDGTGHTVFVEGLDICGKTGTVELIEKGRKRDICWFAGFASICDSKIAVVIVTEEGVSGGVTAGPVARKIFSKWKDLQEEAEKREDAEVL